MRDLCIFEITDLLPLDTMQNFFHNYILFLAEKQACAFLISRSRMKISGKCRDQYNIVNEIQKYVQCDPKAGMRKKFV
jgi:hypothetical protein